jgi:hypothetical protein
MTHAITVKPEIMLLEQVLDEMGRGKLRVPRFQRSFVWRPEQMLGLFDSIERGYPIGSLLVWDTDRALPSLDRVANIDIPPMRGQPVSYLLDGHQRLSTLFGSLSRRTMNPVPGRGQQAWMWDIYRALGRGRTEFAGSTLYQHWRQAGQPPAHYLPMRAVLRTMDFLAYARDLAASEGDALGALVDDAEQVAQEIKSYKIAVIRLVGGELSHAVEVFARLNSSGQAMTPDQMVSALTYEAEVGASLSDRITLIQESLSDLGYGSVPSITIFRSILAVAGEEDVQEARWEVLAKRVRHQLSSAMVDTELALQRAVSFLRDVLSVPLARLVPYNAQIMLLVAFFGLTPGPSAQQSETLVRWFWSTSWSGFFAGANSTQIKQALQEMRDFAAGRQVLKLDDQVARPYPDRFDLRGARIRAFILWELREFAKRQGLDGREYDPVDFLARSDSNAYRQVVTGTPSASSPANRLILPTPPRVSLRRALVDLSGDQEAAICGSHGIPSEALARLKAGDGEGFITERAAYLAHRERAFMVELGVEPSAVVVGEADIDTE